MMRGPYSTLASTNWVQILFGTYVIHYKNLMNDILRVPKALTMAQKSSCSGLFVAGLSHRKPHACVRQNVHKMLDVGVKVSPIFKPT